MTGLRPIVEGMNMGFLLLAFNQISNNMGMLRYTGGNFTIPRWCAALVVWDGSWVLSTANGWRLISTQCLESNRGLQHPHQCQGSDEGRHPG